MPEMPFPNKMLKEFSDELIDANKEATSSEYGDAIGPYAASYYWSFAKSVFRA